VHNVIRKASALGIAIVTAAAALAVAPAASAAVVIQPGMEIATSTGGCTASFVFDGQGSRAGRVYIGTAAHCVSFVGQDVRTGDGVTFGDVAFIGNENTTQDDYAFINVRTAYKSRVRAAVKGHPDMPTGVARSTSTSAGDMIQFSGYGVGFGLTPPTQEQRVGTIVADNSRTYEVFGPVIFGDSGGPLVHIRTKRAYGIVSRLCLGAPCSVEGPTVEGSLAKAAWRGFSVRLRTV
jgi:hypothetical protein